MMEDDCEETRSASARKHAFAWKSVVARLVILFVVIEAINSIQTPLAALTAGLLRQRGVQNEESKEGSSSPPQYMYRRPRLPRLYTMTNEININDGSNAN